MDVSEWLHVIPAEYDALAQLDARVLSHDPDTVFIEFAVNDALDGYNISLEQSRDNLNLMIDRILADRSDREVILTTMNPAWDPPGEFPAASARPQLAQYYQGYRNVAAERGLLLIDHYQNWVQLRAADPQLFEQYIPDGVDPTEEALLEVVTPEIIRALTVPEPGSARLLLIAAAGLSCRRRHRNFLSRWELNPIVPSSPLIPTTQLWERTRVRAFEPSFPRASGTRSLPQRG